MTCITDVCSNDEKTTLLEKFETLRKVCLPSKEIMAPSFKFKTKKDFKPTDELLYGFGGMTIAPDCIREYSYQDRETLRDNNVDFIKAGNQRWFYNTWELDGNFFSEDGQKKVEVDFNLWMDAEQIWSVPGVKQAMRAVLTACAGDNFPTEAEAQKFFTDEICHRLYQRQSSVHSVKQSVLELMEPLRKTLATELLRTHVADIAQSPRFKMYLKENPTAQNKALPNQVHEYLKKNKNAIYLFGEKFGLIKGANKAIHYQEIRDSVRHPDEVQSFLARPQRVYEDFCTILMRPRESEKFDSLENIVENLEVANNLGYMSEILDILAIYEDKTLKKKDPRYWQDLVQKGILESTEVPSVQMISEACKDVAHVNPGSAVSKPIVADDALLLQLSWDISERHARKQAQKRGGRGRS